MSSATHDTVSSAAHGATAMHSTTPRAAQHSLPGATCQARHRLSKPGAASPRTQAGFSLLEVMVALVVGMVLLLGAVTMFSSNQRVYRDQQRMSRLQEDMRFTISNLLHDLRMVGYVGCSHQPDDVRNVVKGAPVWANVSRTNTLQGAEGNGGGTRQWKPGNTTANLGNALANTDAIGVRFLQPVTVNIRAAMSTASAEVPVDSVGELRTNEILAIADCRGADIFALTGTTGSGATTALQHTTSANASASFSIAYDNTAELYRYVSRRYVVEQRTGQQPSLYRYEFVQDINDSDGDSDTTEYVFQGLPLVEGVENMQIAYLAGNTFENANAVSNWGNVSAVRLSLLFRTLDEDFTLTTDTRSYTLLGGVSVRGYQAAAAGDHRRRRMFTTTVQLRNRQET